jgi:simple sugar transport system ATP-binding protein
MKEFPGGVRALAGVNFDLNEGEVHAILGENGAGKTTFMNILYGLLRPDAGEVYLWGKPYTPASPRDAVAAGVGMVHQHFMLIPALTVAENVALGDEPHRGPALDLEQVVKRLLELAETFGLTVNPRAKVADLSVGMRQRVEILKAFYRRARLLILDEPTALLTPQEVHELFKVIPEFTARGVSVIFISHKLAEVTEVAQRVTVVRRGESIDTLPTAGVTAPELARMMVGREVEMHLQREAAAPGAILLETRGLAAAGLEPFDLTLRQGEIVAVAGVEGNGQEPLIGALSGLLPASGEVLLDGQPLQSLPVRERRESGLGLVPSDRQEEGLVLPLTVAENLALRQYYQPPFARGGVLNLSYWVERAGDAVESYDVRPPRPKAGAGALSGGNQQKVVLAREILADPKVLIASQPTRGLDIGATEFVHKQLLHLRDEGRGVLLVSLDLDEILALADRVAVLYRGRLMGILPRAEATRERVGLLMLGSEVAA